MTAKVQPSSPDPFHAPAGLRERKKLKTRLAIRREAYRLFREQGYDATTVDQIAEAADVSPSTFFRYFPSKEDVVLNDEYDPLLARALVDAPEDASLVSVVRTGIMGVLREVLRHDRAELETRLTLIRTVPALRRRTYDQQMESWQVFAAAFAERTGRPANDFELRVASASINAALSEAMTMWAEGGFLADPLDQLDRALGYLQAGLRTEQ
ncbi:TetR family transcriptional regulator [Streptomyces sp. SID3343]|uniref:TetR family transcriptional regulator n=1 Tax=Streptomyces sp. SID3343 TaxID=2690260 RepID=UPI00136E78C0|nr:TetR family transcriptional regulator [Streptomyces sp. SID3343]MYV97601.1 TetR family transcriptional regulator [Streptomyces sp. SID3343]